MSDSSFAPHNVDDAYGRTGPLPTVVKAIAIVAIIFGVIGLFQGFMGLIGALMSGAIADGAAAGLPPQARQPYADLMAAQQTWMPLGLGAVLLSFLVSGFMVFSGITTLAKKQVGTLGFAALGAIGANVVSVIVQVLTRLLMSAEWDAYFEAVAQGPGGEFIQMSTMVGMVIGSGFILVICGFWVWAYITVSGSD
ncbi:MAG: hypothetical protein AB8H79_00720 [Myxococcota bacterium]